MLIKRSLQLSGHATSLALEPSFWTVLEQEAQQKKISLNSLIENIDTERSPEQKLASACRIKALKLVAKINIDTL